MRRLKIVFRKAYPIILLFGKYKDSFVKEKLALILGCLQLWRTTTGIANVADKNVPSADHQSLIPVLKAKYKN